MRKLAFFIVVVCSVLSVQDVNAQLFVSSGSYVYVQNQYVTVTEEINLASNGNIFLRDESQVLQKRTTSNNTGLGSLSIFQEGTVNNFQYNYWCSPVGASSATAGNSTFTINQFHRPTSIINSNPAVILSNSALDGIASSLSIAPRWVFRFLNNEFYADWVVTRTDPINAGEGFTMKGTSGMDNSLTLFGVQNNAGSAQRYDFRGKPNDGNIEIFVMNAKSTLTGNPYPSAIDLNSFLTDPLNNAIDGTALFWEHDKSVNSHLIAQYRGGYGVYNGSSSVYTPATFYNYDGAGNQTTVASTPLNMYQRRFSPIGQGFLIRGVANGSVFMRNTYRVFRREGVVNQSQFERNALANSEENNSFYEHIPNVAGIDYTQVSKLPAPHILVNASLNEQAVRQIAMVFLPTSIDGLDKADAKSADDGGNLPFDMYFVLDNKEYVQSASSFDITKRFPVGFKNNTASTFRVAVADFVNFNETENVYLFDKNTNIYHDIKNAEYQFQIEPGVHNQRYEITFLAETLSNPTFDGNSLDVVQNNTTQNLIIHNPNAQDIKEVGLYDLTGKRIFRKIKLGSNENYQFSTAGLSESIYIVKVITADKNELNKKISVFQER